MAIKQQLGVEWENSDPARLEDLLHTSEGRYRLLANNFPNGAVMLFDDELRYLVADGKGLEPVGLSAEALEGKTIWEALPPETVAVIEPHYRATLAGSSEVFEAPCAGFNYLVHTVPVRDSEGAIYCGMVMTQDITAQKRAEEALKKERDFVCAVLETVAALVLVVDPPGRIVRFNRACQELSGYSSEEVVGKVVWDLPLLLPEEMEAVKGVHAQLTAGEFPNRHENHWRTRDGQRRWIAWTNTALLAADGSVEFVIATGIDVTEQRRVEEALEERRKDHLQG
jgi:PAS domain S-box-containing protein